MPAIVENSAVATGLEKISFHSNPKERQCQRMFKLSHSCTHLTRQQSNAQNSPSQASTVCEPRTSVCSTFRKGRGTRDQIANIRWIIGKAREFQKNIYFCFIDYTNAFDCMDHNKLWKNRWDYQTTLPASWETCTQVKNQQLERDMERWTSSKLGKEYVKAVYWHPAYLTYIQSTSCKIPSWN